MKIKVSEADKAKFKKWLKENEIYEIYENAVKSYGLVNISYADDFIVSAFDWAETTEGHEYWYNVDEKWLEYLEDNNE